MTDQAKYFAVADPESGTMTFWRRDNRGELAAWPRGTEFGPTLWKRPGPGREHVIPADLDAAARFAWIQDWHRTIRRPWLAKVKAAIDGDPVAAAARFAALQTCCARCGRSLEDAASRARALGSDCVTRFAPDVVSALVREVGRALAAREAGNEDAALISREAAYADAFGRLRDAENAP